MNSNNSPYTISPSSFRRSICYNLFTKAHSISPHIWCIDIHYPITNLPATRRSPMLMKGNQHYPSALTFRLVSRHPLPHSQFAGHARSSYGKEGETALAVPPHALVLAESSKLLLTPLLVLWYCFGHGLDLVCQCFSCIFVHRLVVPQGRFRALLLTLHVIDHIFVDGENFRLVIPVAVYAYLGTRNYPGIAVDDNFPAVHTASSRFTAQVVMDLSHSMPTFLVTPSKPTTHGSCGMR